MNETYWTATYLELKYNPSRSQSHSFQPSNTFDLTFFDGPEPNSPEFTCRGQWVTCSLVVGAKIERLAKTEDRRVRLMFDADYSVSIAEDSVYADRSWFQWNGKERVQHSWKFSVKVRGDGTVYGGGRGFGCLQQTFSGTWRDGVVDTLCLYSDGSTATFVGRYTLCDLPSHERKHTAKQQAYLLDLTVTMVSLGTTLAKVQIVKAGESGRGEGVYVPRFDYEDTLRGDFCAGFGLNEQCYNLCDENILVYRQGRSSFLERTALGPLGQAMRIHGRRVMGTNVEKAIDIQIYPDNVYFARENPLFDP
jgi:hypothetical protein